MAEISDHGRRHRSFRLHERPTFELLTEAGEFTSACSHHALHRRRVPRRIRRHSTVRRRTGAQPRAPRRADADGRHLRRDAAGPEGREFLAVDRRLVPSGRTSTSAPDGALYVIDYYRPRIEHPEWTSSDSRRTRAECHAGARPGAHLPRRLAPTPPAPRTGRRPRLGPATERPRRGARQPEPLVAAHGAAPARRPAVAWARFAPLEALAPTPQSPLGTSARALDARWPRARSTTRRSSTRCTTPSPACARTPLRLAEPRLADSPSLCRRPSSRAPMRAR